MAINEYEARLALREMGILHPSKQMIENYIRASEAEQQQTTREAEYASPAPQPRTDGRKRGSSKSNLAKALRERGERVIKKIKSGQRGRPRITAPWFCDVAVSVASGLSLPEALKQHGISLDTKALRALSRNKEFRRLLEQERQRELTKWNLIQPAGTAQVPAEPENPNFSSAGRQVEESKAR